MDGRSVTAVAKASTSGMPRRSTGMRITSKPWLSQKAQGVVVALCSVAVMTMRRRSGWVTIAECSAVFSDSVPPLVKMISSGEAPINEATSSRACSTAIRARLPEAWREDALPQASSK